LPLPDAVADLVISNCVINLVPSKQKAFAEIYRYHPTLSFFFFFFFFCGKIIFSFVIRILKPGGRLAISDIVIKKDFPADVKSNVGMFSACFTGAMPLTEVPTILESAGFQGFFKYIYLLSGCNIYL